MKKYTSFLHFTPSTFTHLLLVLDLLNTIIISHTRMTIFKPRKQPWCILHFMVQSKDRLLCRKKMAPFQTKAMSHIYFFTVALKSFVARVIHATWTFQHFFSTLTRRIVYAGKSFIIHSKLPAYEKFYFTKHHKSLEHILVSP